MALLLSGFYKSVQGRELPPSPPQGATGSLVQDATEKRRASHAETVLAWLTSACLQQQSLFRGSCANADPVQAVWLFASN